MADDIEINLRVDGAEEGARKLGEAARSADALEASAGGVTTAFGDLRRMAGEWVAGLSQVDAAERAAMREQRALNHAIGEMDQNASSAITMVRQLATAVGLGGSVGRAAGLIGSLQGAVSQGVALGAAFGPGGAVVGGLIGAASAMHEMAEESARTREELERLRTAGVATMRDLADAAADESGDSWATAMGAARTELETLNDRANELRATVNSPFAFLDEMGAAQARVELRRVEETIAGVTREMNELSEAASRNPVTAPTSAGGGPAFLSMDPGLALHPPAAPTRHRGGRRPADDFDENAFLDSTFAMAEESAAEREAFRLEKERETADMSVEIEREKNDYLRELDEERLEWERAHLEEKTDYNREQNEQMLEDQREFEAEMAERAEVAAEQREEEINSLMGMVGRSSKAIFTAIAQVATGAKSGEEAFMGLLKSFLEMISEYAALKAMTEFADAASSFARYDFGGGAAHLGAGLAFTAVAVATGVGAAAITTSAPQAPARPSTRGEDTSGGGASSTTVINWNSPVVTAGTRAELGREMESLLGEAAAA